MGKRGRPPKPIAQHLREGTYRKDRHGAMPKDRDVDVEFLWRCAEKGVPNAYRGADRAQLKLMRKLYLEYEKHLKGDDSEKRLAIQFYKEFKVLAMHFGMFEGVGKERKPSASEDADRQEDNRFFSVVGG